MVSIPKPAFFISVCFILLLPSCSQRYVSPALNVPLFTDKAETQGSIQIGTNGYGITFANSPLRHLAFVASGNVFTGTASTDHTLDYKHIGGEAGAGTYFRLSDKGRLEFFSGIGEMSSGDFIERWNIRRYFAQANIGITGQYIDAAISPRITYASHFQTKSGSAKIKVNSDNELFFEPALTLRGGMNEFKFQFQAGLSMPLSGKSTPLSNSCRTSFFLIGIHFTLFKDFPETEEPGN